MTTLMIVPLFAFAHIIDSTVPAPSQIVDTEAATNILFDLMTPNVRKFNLSLNLNAQTNNNLEIAFGQDFNADGVLDRSEIDVSVGWDSGTWFYQDRRAEVEEYVPREECTNRLDWLLTLNTRREAASLETKDRYGSVFSDNTPSTLFNANWNLVLVTARGLSDSEGSLSVKTTETGMIIRMQ